MSVSPASASAASATSAPIASSTTIQEFRDLLERTKLSGPQKKVIFDTLFPGEEVALFGSAEPKGDTLKFSRADYADGHVLGELIRVFINRIKEIAGQINADPRNIDEKQLDLLANILVLSSKIGISSEISFKIGVNRSLSYNSTRHSHFETVFVKLLSGLTREKIEFNIASVIMPFNCNRFSDDCYKKIKDLGYAGAIFVGYCVQLKYGGLNKVFELYLYAQNAIRDHFKGQTQNTLKFRKDMLHLFRLQGEIDITGALLKEAFVKFYVEELVLFTSDQANIIRQHYDRREDLEKLVILEEDIPHIMRDNNSSVVARANKLVELCRVDGMNDLLIDKLTKADLVDSDSIQLLVLVSILLGHEDHVTISEKIISMNSRAIFCKCFESVQNELSGRKTLLPGDETMLRPIFAESTISHIMESLIRGRECELLLGCDILMFVKSHAQFKRAAVETKQMTSTGSERMKWLKQHETETQSLINEMEAKQKLEMQRKRIQLLSEGPQSKEELLSAKEQIVMEKLKSVGKEAILQIEKEKGEIIAKQKIILQNYLITTLITEFMKAGIDYRRIILSFLPLVCHTDMNVIVLDALAEVEENQEFHNQINIIRTFISQLGKETREILSTAFETPGFSREAVLESCRFTERLAQAEDSINMTSSAATAAATN